jgi:AraC-like DNA-binding protein
LSRLAAAAGYADQAHLARDVAQLTGTTPTSLLRERSGQASQTSSQWRPAGAPPHEQLLRRNVRPQCPHPGPPSLQGAGVAAACT